MPQRVDHHPVNLLLKLTKHGLDVAAYRAILIWYLCVQGEYLAARDSSVYRAQGDLIRRPGEPCTARRTCLRCHEAGLGQLAQCPSDDDRIGIDTLGDVIGFNILVA